MAVEAALSAFYKKMRLPDRFLPAVSQFCHVEDRKYGMFVSITNFTLFIPVFLSVSEMPSLSTDYELVTHVLHTLV